MNLVFDDRMMRFLNNKDKVGSSIILLFALVYLNATFHIPIHRVFSGEVFTARTMPICLAIAAIVTCLIHIFVAVDKTEEESISKTVAGFRWRPCLMLTGSMLLYGLVFQFLGFSLSTFLFLFIGFSILKEKRYLLSASLSAGIALFMWVVLTQLFEIFLDPGDLYRILAPALT